MIVNNITIIESEEAINLLVKSTKKNQYRRFILVIILIICGIPIMTSGFITNDSTQKVMGTLFVSISVAYTFVIFYGLSKVRKLVCKQNEEICTNGVKYTYKFKEQSIFIICESNNKTNKVEYKYDSIKKVVELDTRYVLRLKDYQVLYVNKSGFENSKMEEFFIRNLEKNKLKIKLKK